MFSFYKYKSRIKDIIAYFGASLIPMLLNLLINPLVSINMDPEDFAIVGYYSSFTSLITPLINFYLVQFYIKRYFEISEPERKQLKSTIFKTLIWFSFGMTILCTVGIWIYISLFSSEQNFPVFPYLLISTFSIPLLGVYNLELADYKMRRESNLYLRLSLFNGISVVLLTVVYVVFLKYGALGKMLAPLLTNIIVFLYLWNKNKDLFTIKTSIAEVKLSLKFCLPLALGASLGYFTNGFDKTYLESLNQPIEYGYYIVGASIASYLAVFASAISTTFQPDIYEAIAKNNQRMLLKTFSIQMFSIIIVVICFIFCCPFIVDLLTAGKYTLSTNYARVISLSTITSTLYYNVNCVSIAKGYPKLYLLTTILGSVSIMCLLPIFVSHWNFMGGAYMTVLSYMMFFLINLILLVAIISFNKH